MDDQPTSAAPPADGGRPAAQLDDAGPPPTPHERARARRRRAAVGIALAVIAAAIVVVGVLVAAQRIIASGEARMADLLGPALGAGESEADGEGPGTRGGAVPSDPMPDATVPDDQRIEIPSPSDFSGAAVGHLALLTDIDASERTMLAFQLRVAESFEAGGDIDHLLDQVRERATQAVDDLEILRARLLAVRTDAAGEDVRDTYVEHLDAWADYLEAVAVEPRTLGNSSRYTIPINATADTFVRAVEALVDGEVHAEVRRVAEEIVARGFAGPESAQV